MKSVRLQARGRSLAAALVFASAALVAAGCGSDGGSTAASAATDSAALDFIPKTAIGYVTVDTDLNSDGWKQFDELAPAFNAEFTGIEQAIDAQASDADASYERDIKPWIGDSAGAAILDGKFAGAQDAESAVAWVELDDRASFETFLKERDFTKGSSAGDFTMYDDGGDSHVAVSDDLAFFTSGEKTLKRTVEFDGDSIKDADLGDALDEVDEDALATLVINGSGLRAAAKSNARLKALDAQLKDFNGAAVSFAAKEHGMRVDGFVDSDAKSTATNAGNEVFDELPDTTLFAVGGHDLGGSIQQTIEELGADNPQVQQYVGAGAGALGITVDELASALSGDFAIAAIGDDEQIGTAIGAVAGGLMGGGGLAGVKPADLARAGGITLAFEETDDTGATIEKTIAAASSLLKGQTTDPVTKGAFTVTSTQIGPLPISVGKTSYLSAIAIGTDSFDVWGKQHLVDNDTFSSAWKDADAPDETAGTVWLDTARIAQLANLESREGVAPGGLVGWAEADGTDMRFTLFQHVFVS